MSSKNVRQSLVGLVVVFLSVFLVLYLSLPSYGKEKVLKVGHVNAASSHIGYAADLFKKLVEEKTKGSVKVEVYPAGQIGGTQELVQAMALGTVASYPEIELIFGSLAPYYKLWGVYYLFDSIDEAIKFKKGPLQKEFEGQLLESGIRQLGWYNANFIYNLLSKKPVRNVDDVQGLRNRCPMVETMIRSWKVIGSSPVTLDWGEVYTSLSTNLIDAVDNAIADMYHEGFHEVGDYLCLTRGVMCLVSWNFSDKIWQTLNPSEQEAILEAISEIKGSMKEWSDKDLETALEAYKKRGVQIIETDRTGFSKRIEDKIDYVLSDDKELIDMFWQIRKAQSS